MRKSSPTYLRPCVLQTRTGLILAVVLAVVALGGCGGSSGGSQSGGSSSSPGSAAESSDGWKPVRLKEKGEGEFADVACPAAEDCWATANLEAGGGALFHFDGKGWQRAATPVDALSLYGITCRSQTACWAVGAVGAVGEGADEVASTLVEHYDGKAWTVEKTPDARSFPESGLSGIACPNADECWAAGDGVNYEGQVISGELLMLHYAEGAWTRVEAPSPEEEEITGDGALLACGSPTHCMLLTNFVLPPGIFFQALSCPGAEECIALGGPQYDGAMSAYSWNGKGWGAPEPLPASAGAGVLSFYSLSCSSGSQCVAAGGQPITAPDTPAMVAESKGGRWSLPVQPEEAGELTGVSCAAADQCLAVGGALASNEIPEAEPLALVSPRE
jgi:hypothetical protein